jgi:hypothetical protein
MVTHPLLKELSCLEDVLRLNLGRARVKTIAVELGLGDVLALAPATILRFTFLVVNWIAIPVLKPRMPWELASGMEEDIVEGRVEGMTLWDALEAFPMLAVEDDVPMTLWLVPITWQNDSYLPVGSIWKVVTPAITGLIKAENDLALLLWWQPPGELKCLPIKCNPWMVIVEHVLKVTQDVGMEVGVLRMVAAVLEGICRVMDVELGIYGILALGGEKGACFVGEFTMELENPGPTTIVDRVVQLPAHWGHGKCIVVIADVLPEVLADRILAIVELGELMGKLMEGWEGDLALEAAHAKSRVKEGRVAQPFSWPMEGMAWGTLNIHPPKVMDRPVWIKGLASNGM